MYEQELKYAKIAAKDAGKMLKKEFLGKKNNWLNFKKFSERVTIYDKKSEKIILDILNKKFPTYQSLSEESGKNSKQNELGWIIDPLDGTTNFSINHPLFSVAIALAKNNEVVMGVIYNPLLDELYWATKNKGAYKNSCKLKVSAENNLKKSIITYCHGSGKKNTNKAYSLYRHFHDISHHCRHFGCTSLELAMVAAGNTQAHMISGAKVWDVAAGALIAKEAGAKVTDWKNKTWDKNSSTIIVAEPKIHALCLRELKKIRLI